LNAVNAIIQDLKDAYEYGVLDRKYLDRSVTNSMQQIQFMSKTIDDFRNFFHPNKTKKTFDVKQAAGEVLTLISSQLAAHGISYRVTCHVHSQTFTDFTSPVIPCGEMMLLGYENEMKQVFLNLVNNAKDAIVERREHGLMGPGVKGLIAIEFEHHGERIVIRVADLQEALAAIKTLHGILPICSSCKKIRDDKGAWTQMEAYITEHTDAEFSHGICSECAQKLYPEYFKRK